MIEPYQKLFTTGRDAITRFQIPSFLILAVFHNFHSLFLKLYSFYSVLKWQRTEKKWMDGAFTDLDPDDVHGKIPTFKVFLDFCNFFTL